MSKGRLDYKGRLDDAIMAEAGGPEAAPYPAGRSPQTQQLSTPEVNDEQLCADAEEALEARNWLARVSIYREEGVPDGSRDEAYIDLHTEDAPHFGRLVHRWAQKCGKDDVINRMLGKRGKDSHDRWSIGGRVLLCECCGDFEMRTRFAMPLSDLADVMEALQQTT